MDKLLNHFNTSNVELSEVPPLPNIIDWINKSFRREQHHAKTMALFNDGNRSTVGATCFWCRAFLLNTTWCDTNVAKDKALFDLLSKSQTIAAMNRKHERVFIWTCVQ